MISYFLIFLFLALTATLPMMSQPLSFGLILLLSTFVVSVLSAYFSSSWFAYMTFIVFVGGLLVMFACA